MWRRYRLTLLVALLYSGSCVESPAEVPEPYDSVAPADAPAVLPPSPAPPPPPPPTPPPPAAPPPPPPPPFDAEAAALEREAAARAAFEAEWPLHGVAYHFLAQVRARPDGASPVIGYLRRGSRFRAKPGLRGPGCARGWNEIVGGGFVCRGEGFLLGERPQSFEPSPVPAALGDALPYVYAYVGREDAPQYWRLPSPGEEAQAAALIESLRARAAAIADAGTTEPFEPTAEPDLEAPPMRDEELAPPAALTPLRDGGVADMLPDFLRMRMLRGFYVSVDREEALGDRRFWRTVRGTYVPDDVLVEAQPPSMRGVVLGGEWRPPVGFVYRRGVHALARDPVSGVLAQSDLVEAQTPLILDTSTLERRGARYRMTRGGQIIRESALRIPPIISRPPGIGPGARWIHVDLSEQTLVAYEGDQPVFATLVSTGRQGFETPTGTFRIQSKHVSTTMDDPDSATDAYSIEDVPWTMYFEGSYALHGAFWHSSFGHVRSHGCVNLAPADARWIFQWSEPALPPGWHGVMATPRRPGSFVHITE